MASTPSAAIGSGTIKSLPGVTILPSSFVDTEKDVKILTLGVGESGKSTIWRQIKRMYCGGFSDIERQEFASAIRLNIVSDMKTFIDYIDRRDSIGLPLALDEEMKAIKDTGCNAESLPEIADAIEKIWNDPSMAQVYQEAKSEISDNVDYFFNDVKRISQPDYVPSDEDIIRSRIRTTGVQRLKFLMNGKKTMLVDVGGQLSERKKWDECFNDVDYMMFVVSLSDFDLHMFEDKNCKRTQDSRDLFVKMADSPKFADTPIFFVMNKVDLFKKKLPESPDEFRETYPGFEGEIEDTEAALKHVWHSYNQDLWAARDEIVHEGDGAGDECTEDERARIKSISICAMNDDDIENLFQEIGRCIIH